MSEIRPYITSEILRKLIAEQFPEWTPLKICPVINSGNDNCTYHLGDELLIRLPSTEGYAPQVEKESRWLPKLQEQLNLPITLPIAMGKPSEIYPFPWSVNRYLVGETVSEETVPDKIALAQDLAMFLLELQRADTTDAPLAGKQNFYRGSDLSVYIEEAIQHIEKLKGLFPIGALKEMMNLAMLSKYEKQPVWLHGDVAVGNLLVRNGRLSGVIDFGCMGVGDPACDYVMAWTFFDVASRKAFFETLELDRETIDRARGWALWKAVISHKGWSESLPENAVRTVEEILKENSERAF